MQILYGISVAESINVTNICIEKLLCENIISIPFHDHSRAKLFTDPFFGIVKKVFIIINNNLTEYDEDTMVLINRDTNAIQTRVLTKEEKDMMIPFSYNNNNNIDNGMVIYVTENEFITEKLKDIHSRLLIKHGDFNSEVPEQKMAIRYLTGNEKVLEIGGNIGRNTLVIASLLKDSANLVSLESDPTIACQLIENRNLNNFHFSVENAALSNRALIQKGWDTFLAPPADSSSSFLFDEGFFSVKKITLEEFRAKYPLKFDTLVLDCEGAFYYILLDMPEILEDIQLILMENDYWDIAKKEYVNKILRMNNFCVVYRESGGWGPCEANFFEVWKKY